jgi:SAM-dependent methyltransferase
MGEYAHQQWLRRREKENKLQVLSDSVAKGLLVCPICKVEFEWRQGEVVCRSCGVAFSLSPFGEMDLRVQHPTTSGSHARAVWARGQNDFESWDGAVWVTQSPEYYHAEIDSVKEIYENEFQLTGTVVDVGGARGTLRHYLDPESTYLSVDPFSGQFADLESHPAVLEAYPCLAEPCRFVLGTAEHLPVRTQVADWVHLRSVLDHLEDPLVAVWEACRVAKPGGSVLLLG